LIEAGGTNLLSVLFTKTKDSPLSAQSGLVKLAKRIMDRMRSHLKPVLRCPSLLEIMFEHISNRSIETFGPGRETGIEFVHQKGGTFWDS
jgi:hypothetical protein